MSEEGGGRFSLCRTRITQNGDNFVISWKNLRKNRKCSGRKLFHRNSWNRRISTDPVNVVESQQFSIKKIWQAIVKILYPLV